MNITASTVKVNVRGIIGWALIVLGAWLGLVGPIQSGATILAFVLIVGGAVLVAGVLNARQTR